MKVHHTAELRSRLTNAAANGSVVAAAILSELKSGKDSSEVLRESPNFFGTKRKKTAQGSYSQVRIVFTACTKDVTNENFPDCNNPQVPWYAENRSELDPATFVKYFKNLGEFDDCDMTYFANSISVDSRVTVKLYSQMSDIYEAYLGDNYSPIAQTGDDNPLHKSCMRGDDVARNAADFYFNFAGAQIIVAKDAGNNIMGRAIVWRRAVYEKQETEIVVSIMDRVYYSHDFVRDMIYGYAKSIGINLRKQYNDFDSKRAFTVLNPVQGLAADNYGELDDFCFFIKVPASQWHKHGAPYMDTFCYLALLPDGSFVLSNRKMSGYFAELRCSSATASRLKRVCPSCNAIHENCESDLCKECLSKILRKTVFGNVILGGTTDYRGETYPARFFKRGRPTPALNRYMQLEKLYK